MAGLADFFVSTDELATRYNGSEGWPSADVLSTKAVTVLEVSTFWAILEGKEWDVEVMDQFPAVIEAEDGPWVHRLPGALVTRFALATPEELQAAATEWAATEEVGAEPASVLPFLERLQALVRNAQATKRGVYLWTTL